MPETCPDNCRLNIAFLTHRLSREGGGLQSAMQGLSGALCTDGHRTSAIGITDKSLAADQQNWAPTNVYATRLQGPTAFGFSSDMKASLRVANPDVVHQHGLWTYASVVGQKWSREQARPRIISPHNMLDPISMSQGATRKQIALHLYERKNLNSAGCIHALVEKEGADIRALGYKTPICVIPNGIEVTRGGPLSESIEALVNGSPYLLYLGRLTEVKKVLELIEAWKRCTAAKNTNGWKLIVAGWGTDTMRQRIIDAVVAANNPHLHFVGPVFGAEKDALFANASAFALPSSSEGLPMAVLESLAHATPVMITQECNLPDVVTAGAGIEIKPNIESIAKGICQLTEPGAQTLAEMRVQAKALADQRYTWTTAAQQFADVYTWLVDGGTRPNNVRWIE